MLAQAMAEELKVEAERERLTSELSTTRAEAEQLKAELVKRKAEEEALGSELSKSRAERDRRSLRAWQTQLPTGRG